MADNVKSVGLSLLAQAEARVLQLEAEAEVAWKTPHVGGVMIACLIVGIAIGMFL